MFEDVVFQLEDRVNEMVKLCFLFTTLVLSAKPGQLLLETNHSPKNKRLEITAIGTWRGVDGYAVLNLSPQFDFPHINK